MVGLSLLATNRMSIDRIHGRFRCVVLPVYKFGMINTGMPSIQIKSTVSGMAKVAIFTTNVDAENKTLTNHKCVRGTLNRHFCQAVLAVVVLLGQSAVVSSLHCPRALACSSFHFFARLCSFGKMQVYYQTRWLFHFSYELVPSFFVFKF
jgi:hypothetical protein